MSYVIELNDVFESVTQEAPFALPCRILWIDRDQDFVVLFNLQNPPRQPWHHPWRDFQEMVRSHKLRTVAIQLPDFMKVTEDELSEKQKALRDAAWDCIRPLVQGDTSGDIFLPGAMGKLVADRAKEVAAKCNRPVDRKRLYRALYRYWMFGSVRNALLPNFVQSGAKGKDRQFLNGKFPGRPRKVLGAIPDARAKVLSLEDKEAIRIGYALYKDNHVKTVADAYIRTLNKFYRANRGVPGFSDEEVVLKPLSELPTLTQFHYWGKKAFDDMTILRARKGERSWSKDLRALRGRAKDGLYGPCHRFEIDATIADIYLVSRFNRNWIIGRPVVYVVVDVFSRMIVGVFVGLEGPSWNGARQALLNAFRDKVAFCAEHDVHIQPQDWPCHHLPQEICADRGEMLGLAAEGVVSGLGIDLAIAPPYRPDWKSIVESRFRLLNQLTQIHWTPGGVAERIKERGQRDYRLDATLNLKEFTQIVISGILHYNHHSRQPDWLDQDMITRQVDATPIGMWNWGIDQGLGRPNKQADDLVKLHLMCKATATVQAGGVYFEGRHFVEEGGGDGMRYARARAKGRQSLDVWHDVTQPHYLWVRDESKSLRRYVLRNDEQRYQDSRLEEIQDMLQILQHTSPEQRYAELVSKVQLDQQIQSTIALAEAEKKAAERPASKSARLADIRGNRAVEKLAERLKAGEMSTSPIRPVVPAVEHPAPATASTTAQEIFGDRSAEVIDFLSQLRKKS